MRARIRYSRHATNATRPEFVLDSGNRIMWAVAVALAPGFAVLSWFYGWGYVWNLLIAAPTAYVLDRICNQIRGRAATPVQQGSEDQNAHSSTPQSANQPLQQQRAHLFDGSIFLGTLILILTLPPNMPWHVLAVASVGMVVLARQLYGGLGHNIFNPAMVGYVLALICFPAALATWPPLVDGHTGATALTAFKYREGLTAAEVYATNRAFGQLGGFGWEWANIAFACAGLVAAGLGLLAWRVVLGFLLMLGVLALLFYDGGSSRSAGSPLFHYFSAGTMLAAFFVLTDPVTHPGHPTGQWLFGALAAGITFAIRAWGGYPDGIAFAVLIANAAAPFLDALVRGRVQAP